MHQPENTTKSDNCDSCNDICSLFDFMANTIGIKVLHPGGYGATRKLSSLCGIEPNSHVLDLACGTGTTSFFLSEKYKCKVTGIDLSEDLIRKAREEKTRQKKASVNFDLGNALNLPYADNSFDCVISQAFFVLIDDHEKALKEIDRVLKPGGFFGSLELGWFKTPTKKAYTDLVNHACEAMIPRMMKFEEWETFFGSGRLTHLETLKYPMPAGVGKLLKTEGIMNFLKIMFRMMTNSQHRKRMMKVQKTFSEYSDYFGYGLFTFQIA